MNEVLTNGSRPSPPPSNSATAKATPALVLPNASTSSEIRCFCGYDQDDGFTIMCDRCSHWQHGLCVKINQKNVPDTFICYYCDPRELQAIDVERAKDHQRKRIEGEGQGLGLGRKAPAQPKRTSAASHRKRETNGASHSRTHSEGISHKLQSPKEHTGGKPRGRQRPISAQHHTALPDTSASPDEHSPTGKSPSIEREVGSDSEVPPSFYTKEYSPISTNTIVSPDVDHKIKSWTNDAKEHGKYAITTSELSSPWTPRRYTTAEFHELIPSGHTVRWVSTPEEVSALGLPLIRLVADTPSKADQFVIEYIGEIGSKTSYIQDTLNQYQRIRHPKAFVLFHPQLPIYIDARRCGSEARFVRRSCRPNLKFETMIIDGTDLRFALYTNKAISQGTELTIGWEWDPTLPFSKLLEEVALEDIDPEELQKMTTWVEVITATVGECACSDREACIIARLKGEVPVGKSKKSIKAGTKRRWKEIQDSNSTGRDGSPEKQDPENKYKRRSSSTSSHRKSESRDRTPTFPSADISQSSVITDQNASAREARKMKETISLIDKLTNPDTSHNRKRIKRPGAGPATPVQPANSNSASDVLDRPKLSAEPSTPAPTVPSQSTVPDASSSTKTSPSVTSSVSPIRTSPKASYVDGGVQTESDISRAPVNSLLPTSRKMRILAQFRAQNQKREQALNKQLSIVKEESPPIKLEVDQDIAMTDIDSTDLNHPVIAPIIDGAPLASLQPHGTNAKPQPLNLASAETGDYSVFVNGNHTASEDVDVSGNSNLHVHPPSTPFLQNGPSTPGLQATSKQAFQTPGSTTSPLSPYLPPTPGLPPSGTATSNAPRKKLSLSDYTRRKAESLEKDKPIMPATKALATVADVEIDLNGIPVLTDSNAMDIDPPNTTTHTSPV
ncbi:hypothetical protein ABW19_dt0203960 [Dactylella cylindrospora]|nr:hypothetical protein ABW19_dt0203960 [Dactylella cylindrospora]